MEQLLKEKLNAEAERLDEDARNRETDRIGQLRNQYVMEIRSRVESNWLRPPDSSGDLCRILIHQIPGGEIVGVKVTDCDGDPSFQRSVEAAVWKSSPLPLPEEAVLFDREIEFVFNPQR